MKILSKSSARRHTYAYVRHRASRRACQFVYEVLVRACLVAERGAVRQRSRQRAPATPSRRPYAAVGAGPLRTVSQACRTQGWFPGVLRGRSENVGVRGLCHVRRFIPPIRSRYRWLAPDLPDQAEGQRPDRVARLPRPRRRHLDGDVVVRGVAVSRDWGKPAVWEEVVARIAGSCIFSRETLLTGT